jgi:hypothetical protein
MSTASCRLDPTQGDAIARLLSPYVCDQHAEGLHCHARYATPEYHIRADCATQATQADCAKIVLEDVAICKWA